MGESTLASATLRNWQARCQAVFQTFRGLLLLKRCLVSINTRIPWLRTGRTISVKNLDSQNGRKTDLHRTGLGKARMEEFNPEDKRKAVEFAKRCLIRLAEMDPEPEESLRMPDEFVYRLGYSRPINKAICPIWNGRGDGFVDLGLKFIHRESSEYVYFCSTQESVIKVSNHFIRHFRGSVKPPNAKAFVKMLSDLVKVVGPPPLPNLPHSPKPEKTSHQELLEVWYQPGGIRALEAEKDFIQRNAIF